MRKIRYVILTLAQDNPRIMLIHSGKGDLWWAHVDAISRTAPEGGYPFYYGGDLSISSSTAGSM